MIKNARIFSNPFYIDCLRMALTSKNDKRQDQAFGAVLVNQGQIIGRGVNRAISHPRFKLERIIKQGWVNHAEVEALNDALVKQKNVEGGLIYVAGLFLALKLLFFQSEYTCVKCISPLRKYGIRGIMIPTPNGWIEKSIDEAETDARGCQWPREHYRKRIGIAMGEYSLDSAIKE